MRLHLTDEGPRDAGTPLVLLCSLGSTVDMWSPQREELARERRVVTVDTRGHGGSPVPDGPYTVPELAEDVLETLTDLGVERADFAGVSLGGAVGQAIALRAPGRTASLALLCTAARFGNLATFTDRASRARSEGMDAIADGVVTRWFTDDFARADPDTVSRMRDMIAATPPEGYAGCCEAIVAWDSRDDLGRIAAPTLVVSGAEDPATPPDDGRLLADGIPGARFEVVPDAAHLASYQRPEIVTGLLAAHLKDSGT
ncbi:3-oxoadipate enol-lactonase [Actinomycetospora sp. TBRC 11914]|uniref:3-oxoadipate enol-lactonase n=1 Tax=Actinomycetospora sp. TBRC 11914 TaxID=2729387 RepID=UPI00145E2E4C|nr:3-oxoadipate enol-lactonase [Actinomycetospora sp. TBRC 11914]NMO89301.1 3-oxoadipate enol-lactonase [Actinomycetospora sp. TBRC 11914]